MIDAAQEAAAVGDYPAAERLLREALAIQEVNLGSSHSDLATTLNNLALACERTNKPAEAERCYRRAHAIAVASLGPRHPFVATSLKNLLDFCAAREIPIWTPPVARTDDETAADSSLTQQPPEVAIAPTVRPTSAPVAVSPWAWAIAVAGVSVAVSIVWLFVMPWRTTDTETLADPPSASALDRSPTPESTTPVPAPTAEPAVPRRENTNTTSTPVERREPRERGVTPAPVTVLSAQLCSAIAKRGSPDWQCTQASGDLPPGTYMLYTRLLTNQSTMVEHRWYRDERVHQVMRLRIAASPESGYRTFSSNTVGRERAGDWRVELRALDGTLLHEERFTVR
jgi:hypothetical protein